MHDDQDSYHTTDTDKSETISHRETEDTGEKWRTEVWAHSWSNDSKGKNFDYFS